MSEKKNMTGKENSFHMENFRRRSRYAAVFLVLILAFAAITVLNINSGNVNISIPEIFRILLRRTGEGKAYNIIWKIRLPRILMAAILGGALSLSGFLLQTFFENPIAGPFVLGISSGAKMVVALTMIFYLEWARNITSYTMIVAAFLGSLLSVGFILLMSRRIKNMAGLLVGGIMIGYICSAVTDFVVTFAEDSDIVNLHGWSQGSFSGMSWRNVAISAAVIFSVLPVSHLSLLHSVSANCSPGLLFLLLHIPVSSSHPHSYVSTSHMLHRYRNLLLPSSQIPPCFLLPENASIE